MSITSAIEDELSTDTSTEDINGKWEEKDHEHSS